MDSSNCLLLRFVLAMTGHSSIIFLLALSLSFSSSFCQWRWNNQDRIQLSSVGHSSLMVLKAFLVSFRCLHFQLIYCSGNELISTGKSVKIEHLSVRLNRPFINYQFITRSLKCTELFLIIFQQFFTPIYSTFLRTLITKHCLSIIYW